MADILTSKIQVPSLPDDTLILKDAEARQDLSTAVVETTSSNPVTFSTRSAQNAQSAEIVLEPVQDLHGYDHPWPEGGGKNLWGGEKLADDIIAKVTGVVKDTTNKTITFSAENINKKELFTNFDENKRYTVILYGRNTNNNSTSTNIQLKYSDGSFYNIQFQLNGSNSYAIAYSEEGKILKSVFGYWGSMNAILYYDKCGIFEGVVELEDFSPYSNICPISGRSNVSLVGIGKNLWGGEKLADDIVAKVTGATKDSTNKTVTYSAQNVQGIDLFVNFENNKRYTLMLYGRNAYSDRNYANIVFVYTDGSFDVLNFSLIGADSYCITNSAKGKTLKSIRGYWDSQSTILNYEKCGLFEGVLTVDDFVPYTQSNQITISFGQTVYGGTVDVVSGKLSVTWGYIASYNGETLPGEWISDRDVYASGTTPTTGAEVCYELATLITYQLTPNEIKLLSGANTIWTDGNSVKIAYRDGKVATLSDLQSTANNLQEQIDQNETMEDETTQLLYKLGVNNGLLFIEEV